MDLRLIPPWGEVVTGRLNVCPEPREGCAHAPLTELHPLAHPASCKRLAADDALSLFPPEGADGALRHWLSLLAHGGEISLSGPDSWEISRLRFREEISLEQFNAVLFGPAGARRSCLDAERAAAALSGLGLEITGRFIERGMFHVTARRS